MDASETAARPEVEAAGATDVGRQRDHNEDVLLIRDDLGLYVVCDGMGGHAAGEVAARLGADGIAESLAGAAPGADRDRLVEAMRFAHRKIREEAASHPDEKEMGTTAVVLWLSPSGPLVGWAGDARAYRLRGEKLERLTEDHSFVAELVRAGVFTEEQAARSPRRNIVTRALGPTEEVTPEVRPLELMAGDVILLCCDGLHGMVADPELATILRGRHKLDEAAQALIDAANQAGGVDNITCVLVRVRG